MTKIRSKCRVLFSLLLAASISSSAFAVDKSSTRSGLVKLPQAGGTVTGETGSFSIDGNRGASNFQLPLQALPTRGGVSPSIGLSYNQFQGDSGLGMGWNWSVPAIETTRELGVPIPGQLTTGEFRNFLSLGGEKLIFLGKRGNQLHYKLEKSSQSIDIYFHDSTYSPLHAKSVGENKVSISRGFEVHYPDGRLELYSGDLTEAEGKNSITTRYPLVYTVAPTGESIAYSYNKIDQKSYLTDIHFANGRSHYQFELMAQPRSSEHYTQGFAQKISRRYNKVVASFDGHVQSQMCFAFSGRDLETQTQFSIRSHTDCQSVARAELSSTLDTNALHVTDQLLAIYRYGNDETLLANSDRLPTVYFDYSSWTKSDLTYRDLAYPLSDLIDQTGFAPENYELSDLNHDSLVDIVRRNGNNTTDVFYASGDQELVFDSGSRWELKRDTQQVSPNLSSENFHFADMNGDTYVDVVEFSGSKAYIYLGLASGGFESIGQSVSLDSNQEISGNMFKDGYARFMDMNADGKSDILTTTTSTSGVRQFKVYFNFSEKNAQGKWDFFLYGRTYRTPENASSYSLANNQIKFVDVNGDRLPDLLQLRASGVDNQSGVCVYQNRGDIYDIKMDTDYLFGEADQQFERCGWGGQFITLNGLRGVSNLNNLWLADINGDGVLDFSTIGDVKTDLLVWLGLGDLSVIDQPYTFKLNIPVSINLNDASRSRVADIDGDGQSEILLFNASNDVNHRVLLLDFNRTSETQLVKANLLTTVGFESGVRHDILYATSTDERVRDIRQGKTVRNLHFPVILAKQLISSYGKRGQLRDNVKVQEFFYHQPFYNADDNEFAGFETIEQLTYGDDYVKESHYSISHYHTGADGSHQHLAGQLNSKEDYQLSDDAYFEQAARLNRSFDPNNQAVHSLSQLAREQVLPSTATLLQKIDISWQAHDLGGYSYIRQLQTDSYQYASSAQTGNAHQRVVYENFDVYNLPAKVTETESALSAPLGVNLPVTTTITETYYDQARTKLSALGIVITPSSVYQSRNGGDLSYQEYDYFPSGLLASETRYTLSRMPLVPAELKADHQAASQKILNYQYDSYGNTTELRDNIGVLETVTYDSNGIFPVQYDVGPISRGQRWEFQYKEGRLDRFKTTLGLWNDLTYDNLGRKKTVLSDSGAQQNFFYKPSLDGNPLYILTQLRRYASTADTPTGEQTFITRLAAFNPNGTLLAELEDAHGSVLDSADGIRVKSYSVYNRQQQKTFEWTPYKISGIDVEGVFANRNTIPEPSHQTGKSYAYDALGRLSEVVFPTGKIQSLHYEPWGSLSTTTYKRRDANVVLQRYEIGNSMGVYAVAESDGASQSHITTFNRDVLGRLSQITLPQQSSTRLTTYDSKGRLEYQKLPDIGERFYVYDSRDRLVAQLRYPDSGTGSDIIRHQYDDLDRITQISTNGQLHTQYEYDQYTTAWDTQSAYHTLIPQPVGLLTQVTTFDGNGLYDFQEQLGYDQQGRTVHRQVTLGEKVLGESYEFTLDGTERRIKNPHGLEGVYALGKDSYLRSVHIRLPGEDTLESVLEQVTYNGGGQLEQIRYRQTPSHYAQTSLTYDPHSLQLTDIQSVYTQNDKQHELQNLSLELDQNYSVLSIQDAVGETDYGHVDRTGEFTYNWKDELTSVTRFGKTLHYQYSAAGSFTQNDEMGDSALNAAAQNTIVPQSSEDKVYEFDGYGQLIRSPKLLDAKYNAFGQLIEASTNDNTVYYGYNGQGSRIYKKVVSKISEKVEDSLYPMASIAFEPKGAQSYLFVAGSRLVRLEHETGEWFYYLKDHLGSSDIVMASDGVPVEQMLYQPYGTEEAPGDHSSEWTDHIDENADKLPKEKTHHRFTGHYLDDDTGLYDFGLRYYDPQLGRFISPDPKYLDDPRQCLATVRECNLYIYAINNPLKFMDDDGQSIWSKAAKVIYKVSKGGSAADAFADNIRDVNTLFSANASLGDRAFALLSLASEVAPVSVSDIKDVTRIVKNTPVAGFTEKVYSNVKDRTKKIFSKSPCCFVAGTRVLTSEGYKNIEEIDEGDLVWSKDTESGEQAFKPVIKLFVRNDRNIYELVVHTTEGEKLVIETTDDHPFYVTGKGWKRTLELDTGDNIETDSYGAAVVVSVTDEQRIAPTYNFTIEDFHTYYVTERNLLVHNENCKKDNLSNVAKGVKTPHTVNTGGKAPKTSEPNSIVESRRADGSSSVTYYDDKGRAFSREDYGQQSTHGSLGRRADGRSVAHEHRFDYNERGFPIKQDVFRELSEKGTPAGPWIKNK